MIFSYKQQAIFHFPLFKKLKMKILKNIGCQTEPVTILQNVWPGEDEWRKLYPSHPSFESDESEFEFELPATPTRILFKDECPPAPKKKYPTIASFMRPDEPSPVRKSSRAKVNKPLEFGYWKYVSH